MPSKRRASSVSTDTEDKLARAVQSAQRLAQLSDVPRDDSTLDLFPDDPTRPLVESMTIDVRQGTLSGFELPAVVRAAVEAAHRANAVASAAATPKRAARTKGTAAGDGVAADPAVKEDAAPDAKAAVTTADLPMSPGRAAADDGSASTDGEESAQREAADAQDARRPDSAPGESAEPVSVTTPAAHDAMPAPDTSAPQALPAARPRLASPELDRARATAFADTVDALYGVIADQRRTAADLTRRMKWMMAIVAGALLATVGVGITQTLLLSRLARDAAAQQQRIEQMLQTQQSALTGMLARVAMPPAAPAAAPADPAAAHSAPATPVRRHLPHGRLAHPPAR